LRRVARNPSLLPDATPSKAGVAALAQGVRAQGYASVDGQFIPGLVAIAAPILDWQGQAQAVVTLVGVDPKAAHPGAPEVAMLRAFCKAHSVPKGH
jgi:DNA-binding IclR family transcriptional regulator